MKSRRIKILLVQSRICVGGPAVHTEMIARYLPQERYKVTLVGGGLEKGELSKFDDIREKGIDIRIIGDMKRNISLFGDVVSVYKTWRLIKQVKPDIVDTHTAKAGATGRIAAWLAGVPVIIHTFHGHAFEKYFSELVSGIFIIIEKLLAQISTKIIAISPLQFQDLAQKFKIAPEKKFIIMKYGIELEQLLYLKKNKGLKESLGIPSQELLIGIIGRMVPIKNQTMMVRVLKILHDNGCKAHLCIAGDGEERPKIEHLGKELGLKEYIHLSGWVLDMQRIYAGIDIMSLTSLNEGTPFTVIEAMAAGVPVVATNVGGVGDLIQNNKYGLLCRSEDEQDMAQKILQTINESHPTEQRCRLARDFVMENYSRNRLIRDLDQLYTRLFLQYYQQERS